MKRMQFDTFDTAQFVQPGVRGRLTRDLSGLQDVKTAAPIALKKGQKLIIQPIGTSVRSDYLLTCYIDNKSTKRDDMPESGGDIISGDVFQVSGINPKKTFRFEEFFYRSREPLFPGNQSPSVDEINQFLIPDCTLLATLQAILNHPNGAAYIRDMLHDNGDSTTTIRFFEPKTRKPIYYTVTNSIAYSGNTPLSSHPVLWVHVLEKAFAARGMRDNETRVDSSIPSVYASGLMPKFCLESMVNTKGKIHQFNLDAKKFLPQQLILTSPVGEYLISLFGMVKRGEAGEEDLKIFIREFFKNYLNNIEDIEQLIMAFPTIDKEAIKERYLEMLVKIFSFPDIFPLEESKIISALNNTPYYETYLQLKKCGSDQENYASRSYSDAELEAYSLIQESLARGGLVTASCGISDIGLIDEHAYSVMAVFEKGHEYRDKITGEKKLVKRLYVQVRNPWGSFGRDYDEKEEKLEPKKTIQSEFLVELKDFYRCFGDVCFSDSVNRVFEKAEEKQRLENNIHHLLNAPMSFEEYSFANLIAEDFLVEKTTNDLVSLELLSLSLLTEEENQKIVTCLAIDNEEIRKESIFSALSIETIGYFGDDSERIKARLYYLIMIRSDYNNAKKYSDLLQENTPYAAYWKAIQIRKNVIHLFVSYETNIFLESLESLNNKLMDFLEKLEMQVNSVDFIANNQVALEAAFSTLSEHYVFIKKFSIYLPNYYETFDAVEEKLKALANFIAESKKQSMKIVSSMNETAASIFTQMIAEANTIEQAAFRWNSERHLSDAAKQAISSAIAAHDISLARTPLEQSFVSDAACVKEITKQVMGISALQKQFKLLCKGIFLSGDNQYERGVETTKETGVAIAEVLAPFVEVQDRLAFLEKETDSHAIKQLLKSLRRIKEALIEKIRSSLSEGQSYYEMANGDIGRIVSNMAQCFDDVTCASLKADFQDSAKKEVVAKRVGKLSNALDRESTLAHKEMNCCSFALDYVLAKKLEDKIASKKPSDNVEHYRKTYLNLTKLKRTETELPMKSEAYLLMRDCTRTDSEENKKRFVAFTERPDVKKSSIGKTIAISMLGFLGVVGIAGLIVLTHGLALPLIPILIAKGLAAGAIAASATGLGGVVVEAKLASNKQSKLKNMFASFFKTGPKNEDATKEIEAKDKPKKIR
ncbi:MAG: hypothetical protein Q8L78_06295 [Coxiellaceae bacterium]|nr:hypothetical protein [Coxiellaceae bacterium]